jgi:ABC-type multidrug transport system ATPase subunit
LKTQVSYHRHHVIDFQFNSMHNPVVDVHQLAKTYAKRGQPAIHALNGISFQVGKGEIFGLLGPNGAGKSTTIKILTTLLPPTSGTALIHGFDVTTQGIEVRKTICAVIQDNAVEQYLTVRNNFLTFGRFHGLGAKEIGLRMGRVCELFDLQEHMQERGIDLSGGMKRRVQVAKVFLVDKPLVFLDEATTGMDAFNKRTTMTAIREEVRKGRTILLTTHMLDEAEALCSSIAIVNHGNIIASGSVDEVKSMSLHLYYLSLQCCPPKSLSQKWFLPWNPVSVQQEGESWVVGLRNELEALEVLKAAQLHTTIEHFEISSADLEDAFIELIDRKEIAP